MRALVLLPLLLAACGLSDKKPVAELSESQADEMCAEYDVRSVTCGEGDVTLTLDFNDDCAAMVGDVTAECTATVGDYRFCMDAVAAASDDALCSEGIPRDSMLARQLRRKFA